VAANPAIVDVEASGTNRVPSGVVGMTLFLFTEAMIFAALISAFLVLQARAVAWPPPGQPRLPVGVTGANTLVLLASGVTMLVALARARAGAPAVAWIVATAALGAAFLLVQGAEWARLIGFGLTGESGVYAATFYTLVGIHALHVVGALVVLLANLARVVRRAAAAADGLRICAMYWVFVVAVWPVLYLLLYQPWKG
jgi:heme/copper-type cytochrome/quinol oxidase subunit 3